MNRVLLLYVPVLHAGYLNLFEKHRGDDALYLISDDAVEKFAPFRREIRAIGAERMRTLIASLGIFPKVAVFSGTREDLATLKNAEIVTATDMICRKAVAHYFPDHTPVYENAFLRWDESNVDKPVNVSYDRVSKEDFDRNMCAEAGNEADQSSDWWRHVGAIVVKDGAVIARGHNHHVPSDHTPYANGDPRDVIKSGTLNLVYSSLHAEQTIIAEAARRGTSLAGTDMYLNYFPCPLCAKLMASAGIKRCFFKSGATWLDAESVLHAAAVEIVLVA